MKNDKTLLELHRHKVTLLIWSSIDSKLGLTKIPRNMMILNACHSFYVNSEERRSDVKERKIEIKNIHGMMNGTLKPTKIRHRTYVAHFSKTKVFFCIASSFQILGLSSS